MGKAAKNMILHIEDDVDQREMIKSNLSARYVYLGVDSAEEAELHLSDKNLRLIILDLALPLMNGFEFLKKNKRGITDRAIPVIITTGLEGAGVTVLAEDFRCAAVYRKPIPPHELIEKIKELVR